LIVELLPEPLWVTPRRTCESDHGARAMEFEVFKRHILRPMLSIDMVEHVFSGRCRKRCYGRKKKRPMAKEILLK